VVSLHDRFYLSLSGLSPRVQPPALVRYGVAVLLVGLSALVGLWFRPATYHSAYLFFYAAILISLIYGGLDPVWRPRSFQRSWSTTCFSPLTDNSPLISPVWLAAAISAFHLDLFVGLSIPDEKLQKARSKHSVYSSTWRLRLSLCATRTIELLTGTKERKPFTAGTERRR